jgi:thymidylate synthase (FAD)
MPAEVNLISIPENFKKIIYTACRTCYSADNPINIWDADFEDAKYLKLIERVLFSSHYSTIEHCQLVFSISGVSRVCTHQIVRHRHMSFSQKSQRYVTEKGQFGYVVPPTVKGSELEEEYIKFMGQTSDFYARMIAKGIPAEDARYVLPNAATSSMMASLNLRSLIHLANLRLCAKAQKEIRDVVKKMSDLAIEKEPWLKEFLKPKCFKDGFCEERNGCGLFEPKVKHGKKYWKAGE